MNLREERNFLDLPCVTVIKDLRRRSSNNSPDSGSDLRKRIVVALMLDEVEWRKSEVRVKI